MELSFYQWLLQGIPECLALAALAVTLSGRKLEAKKIFLIGLSHAPLAYLVRLLPLSFGVHFIILIVVLSTLLHVWLKISLSRGLLTALSGLIILATAETVFVAIIHSSTGVPFEEVRQELLLWVAYGWPHIIFLLMLALFIDRRRKGRDLGGKELNA